MTDRKDNGKSDRRAIAELLRGQMDATNDDVLRDMTASFPAIRRFLLGGTFDGNVWPAGSVAIRRAGYYICVRLQYRELGKEAIYFGKSLADLSERIENDLDTRQAPWEDDYQTRKEEERWLRQASRGS